jgi:hypothetical protein
MRELLECGRGVKRICRFHRDTITPTNLPHQLFYYSSGRGTQIANQSVGF